MHNRVKQGSMLQKMQEDIVSQPLTIHCVSGIEGEADPGAAAAA